MTESIERMLPLYESKLIHQYDGRWATYSEGAVRPITELEKEDPDFCATPRYWVHELEMDEVVIGKQVSALQLGFRDIARVTDERTFISTLLPPLPAGNNLPVALFNSPISYTILACASSFVLDYATRLKVGGVHLNFFVVEQLPFLTPIQFLASCGFDMNMTVATWLVPRILELVYSSWGDRSIASTLGDGDAPFRWIPERRQLVRAEIDAAFFHLYGVTRADTDYIMETFVIVRRKDESAFGEFRTKRMILEIFDAMQIAIDSGVPYQTILDPPPGEGPRHPAKDAS